MRKLIVCLIACCMAVVPVFAQDVEESLNPVETTTEWFSALLSQNGLDVGYYTCRDNLDDLLLVLRQSNLPDDMVRFISDEIFVPQGLELQVDLRDLNIELTDELDDTSQVQISGVIRVAIGAFIPIFDFDTVTVELIRENERWKVCLPQPEVEEAETITIPWSRTGDGAFLLGDSDAPVTIVIFEDFLCPHCQAYVETIDEFIEAEVINGNANVEFRQLIAIDANLSTLAFELVECATVLDTENPNAFRDARATMYDITSISRFSSDTGRQFAEAVGISYEELLACVSSDDNGQWRNDAQLAQTQDWVTGVPAVGWRNASGALLKSPLSTRPTAQELSALVEAQP